MFGESVSLQNETWDEVRKFLDDVTDYFFLKFPRFGLNNNYNPEFVIIPKTYDLDDDLYIEIAKETIQNAYDTQCINYGKLNLKNVNGALLLTDNNNQYFDFDEEEFKNIQ